MAVDSSDACRRRWAAENGAPRRAAYGLRIVLSLASPPCAASPTTPLTRALTVAAGTFETIGFTQIYNMMEGDDDREPGDFGFDPLGLLPGNEEQYKTAELTHGRAAMLAFSAVATQSALPASFGFGQESFPYF